MKSLVIFFLVLFAFSASAQEVRFYNKDSKKEAGVHTRFDFVVDQVSNKAQEELIVSKLKNKPSILKLEVQNTSPTSFAVVVIAKRENDVQVLQEALQEAGIKKFTLNNRSYKLQEFSKAFSAK